MPIPPFDSILSVLPPHLGNPAVIGDLSPYGCSMAELCDRFATTEERKAILKGYLSLRTELLTVGIQGFQWLAGSFLDEIEILESRPPNDIDVVTFVARPFDPDELKKILDANPKLVNNKDTKAAYSVDHFLLPLSTRPDLLVSMSRYWYGLFSHRRDRTWKGILLAPLHDQSDNNAAVAMLGRAP